SFTTTKRNKKRQNQKNDKIFKKMTKKTLYAIILQIHSKYILMQMYFNECMKSLILIQFNPKRRKHEKHILSLTLGSLLVSALSAEDDGFYTSVGYQIGEAAQMVTNTKGIQDLSDRYESLNNLLTRYSILNTLIKLSADPSAVSGAINNLNAGATGLLKEKPTPRRIKPSLWRSMRRWACGIPSAMRSCAGTGTAQVVGLAA
ncbi:outer membrane protein, partial [Helicobacter pylori 10700]